MKKEGEGNEMKEWVRENLPLCTTWAEECRAAFGDVRLVFAQENGHTLGKRGPEGLTIDQCLIGPMNIKQTTRGQW